MIKINSTLFRNTKRYYTKNTAMGRLDRNKDILTLSAAGICVQSFKFPVWDISDISILSILGTFALKSFNEIIKSKMDLIPIKKRAQLIKKATKV